MCSDKIIVSIDDELLSLGYDNVNNRFVSVSKISDDNGNECQEVEVEVKDLYTTKYFPRVYYTIYKLEFSGRSGYLLERYNGTTGSSQFYSCNDFKTCGDYIETLENL